MSLALPSVPAVEVRDPLTQVQGKPKYIISKGGSWVTYQQFIAPSTATSSIQFTLNPPSPDVFVDRKMYMTWFLDIVFTGTGVSGGNLLQLGLNDGLRAYPISTNLTTVALSINDYTVTQNLSDYIQALLRYHNGVCQQDYDLSMTPSMMDQFSNSYGDWQSLGTARNPLAFWGENSTQAPRGSFLMNVISNTNTGAHVQVQVTEPMFVSPFLWGHGNHSAFIGVQNMNFNFTTLGGLQRVWSHFTGSTITSQTVSFYANPQILVKFITPDLIQPIPKLNMYPYFQINRYPTQIGSLAPGASSVVTAQNIQLSSVPNRIYIFARQQNVDQTISSTDTFAYISNVNINFNNKSGILASASPQDLYQIAVRNGYNGSWQAWQQFYGSVLCLEPGKDIGLDPDLAPGVEGNYNLVVQVTVQNNTAFAQGTQPIAGQTINYTLFIVVVSEGTFTIEEQRAFTSTGSLSRKDVLDVRQKATKQVIDAGVVEAISKEGTGDFLSGLKNFFGKVVNAGEKVIPCVAPAVETARCLATHAAGRRSRKGKGVLSGGRRKHRSMRGGAMEINRDQLRDQIVENDGSSGSGSESFSD